MNDDRPRPKNSEKIMNTLIKMAETVEPVGNARLAAAIVIKNEIISFGINRRKSHPFQKKYGRNEDAIFLHAEIDAIKNALRHIDVDELNKATMYVARVKKTKPNSKKYVTGLAKPCLNGCQCAIASFNIRNVYFTTDTPGQFECL